MHFSMKKNKQTANILDFPASPAAMEESIEC